jgi:hypothetical protein
MLERLREHHQGIAIHLGVTVFFQQMSSSLTPSLSTELMIQSDCMHVGSRNVYHTGLFGLNFMHSSFRNLRCLSCDAWSSPVGMYGS